MKKNLLMAIIPSAILLLNSCGEKSPYPGFTKTENGLYFKIHETKEGARKVKEGDILTLNLVYKNSDDSIVFNTTERGGGMQLKVEKSIYKGDISEGFLMLSLGDSASFITSADSFFQKIVMSPLPPFIKPNTNLTFELRLTDISTLEELQAKAKEEAAKMADVENENIKNYLSENNITTPPMQSGLYYIELKKGKGAKAEAGKTVKVHYTGTILDGTKFDSSLDRNEPFEFLLGQGGVIQGWEEGIAYMQAGGKAKLIIPSFLAYGAQERGPVIKPFSTLVFEVELLDVK